MTPTSARGCAKTSGPYCPKAYLDDYDAFVAYVEGENGSHAVDVVMGTTGHFDPYRRIEDLNQDGTAGEVIFHGSQNGQPIPFIISDPSIGMATMGRKYDVDYEHAAVGRHMYNEWLADFCSVEPERHVGLAHLPLWNIDDAIKEAHWARGARPARRQLPVGVRPRPDLEVTLGRSVQVQRPGVGAVLVGV